MPVDIVQLHYVLSAIASGGKILETTLALMKQGIRPSYTAVKADADKYAADLVAADDPVQTHALATSIPKVIIDAVSDSIEQLFMRIAGVLNNTGMEMPEISRRVDADRDRICQYISELSKFGKVPDSMMVIWVSSKCAERGFVLA